MSLQIRKAHQSNLSSVLQLEKVSTQRPDDYSLCNLHKNNKSIIMKETQCNVKVAKNTISLNCNHIYTQYNLLVHRAL